MGLWSFIGKMAVFNYFWKQLFGSNNRGNGSAGVGSVRVRGLVPERDLERQREIDEWRGYNEEVLDAVDDFESRLDDYEYDNYLVSADDHFAAATHETYEDDYEDDYGYGYQDYDAHRDFYLHDDFYAPDHDDFDHDDFFDDHDW